MSNKTAKIKLHCGMVTLILCVFLCFTTSSNADIGSINRHLPCDLYLADSTIPGAGIGIFSAIEKEEGDVVGNGDVCLPMFDISKHTKFFDDGDGDEDTFPLYDYVWSGHSLGMDFEADVDDTSGFWPGLDAAINCHEALLNVDSAVPMYDEGGLHRGIHPGAGAISPYHNGTSTVIRHIPAGGELFKYYGDNWFRVRYQTFGNIPLWQNYLDALRILRKMDRIKRQSLKMELWDLLVDLKGLWNGRTLNALPNTWIEAEKAIQARDMGVLHQPNATRTIKWLQENGKCIDHIIVGQSTIEGAGHGAYAKRDIPRGTIITGTPLQHITNGDVFNMYEFNKNDENNLHIDDGQYEGFDKKIIGKQIILNYCFGHQESTLLLCPYGSGINYINHNQTKTNVKIQWAEHGITSHNKEMLLLSPQEMKAISKTMLAFDYVASRDIAKGEELFLDYGDDWERAWQLHVKNWKPKDSWKTYLSAAQYNSLHRADSIRTDAEQEKNPYPDNLQIFCHSFLLDELFEDKPIPYAELAGEVEGGDPRFQRSIDDKGYPCKILERNVYNNSYKVFIPDEAVKLNHVPRDAIFFNDVPYTTDMHLVQAFRHPLGIPNDMMPKQWKNIPPKP